MALHIEPATAPSRPARSVDQLQIGLVNNMPDAALEATALQFAQLLAAASDGLQISLRLTSIPEVPRSGGALEHIRLHYWPLEQIFAQPPDALIVTGTEPIASSLTDEPYWASFVALLKWAQHNTLSSLWSCLAAHAAVQALDGVRRQRLENKRFGVFEHRRSLEHELTRGLPAIVPMPHSRWNDLPLAQLQATGYQVLSRGERTGADLFVKDSVSLLIFVQGHPEYESTTLLKEFRRDVGRYLRGEYADYPLLPHGYFKAAAVERLRRFEAQARAQRNPTLMETFPPIVAEEIEATWQPCAVRLYHNWLLHLSTLRQSSEGSIRKGYNG